METVFCNISSKQEALTKIIEFTGVLDYSTMNLLINQVEEEMHNIENAISVRKKVINIVIECVENIYKHSKGVDAELFKEKFQVTFNLLSNPNGYVVEIKNVIDAYSEKIISQKLSFINYIDKSALKEEYCKIISKGDISEKGGAGLGLIDIAIKSGNPLQYKFYPIDEIYSYFEMAVSIDKK